jgi:menaquinone-dependent protoporphyrinogen IX oxidase
MYNIKANKIDRGGENHMKSALIIYKSKTGFTKKYVDWILEDVKCSVTTLDKAKKSDIDKYDIFCYRSGT